MSLRMVLLCQLSTIRSWKNVTKHVSSFNRLYRGSLPHHLCGHKWSAIAAPVLWIVWFCHPPARRHCNLQKMRQLTSTDYMQNICANIVKTWWTKEEQAKCWVICMLQQRKLDHDTSGPNGWSRRPEWALQPMLDLCTKPMLVAGSMNSKVDAEWE